MTKKLWVPPHVGCDCPQDAKPGQRCSQKLYRCHGSIKTRVDYLKTRGMNLFGEPLAVEPAPAPEDVSK